MHNAHNYLFAFYEKDLGINISGINLPHLPLHVVDSRTIMHGLKINFIECFIDKSTKDTLFSKLRREYGAVNVETHQGK